MNNPIKELTKKRGLLMIPVVKVDNLVKRLFVSYAYRTC